jgi:hypothetical protein
MSLGFSKSQIALAVASAVGAAAVAVAPRTADADESAGSYVTGDFHNHTTCSDGSTSMQKLVKKSTDKQDTPWGLDWFVQAGHGGTGNRNCTLVEDATLATPAYPLAVATSGATMGPNTNWQTSVPAVQPKGLLSGTPPTQNMWRWQSLQEFQYPLIEYLSALKHKPLFIGVESVTAGHEHTSMSVITGQMPASAFSAPLPTGPGYAALGSATAVSQWEYCFDRADGDTSRGNATVGTVPVLGGNNWTCAVTGSANTSDPSWNATAQKLMPAGGTGTGERGHAKTIEALKWMVENHPQQSYFVPAHLERAGPFNPDGNNGFNIEHIRNFNNVAPDVAFGFETQPGHGASDQRGEYTIRRNAFGTVRVASVGGTTYGGTGVYGAQIGGVWDALLGEGRAWWFFASSDWHNRGSFGGDDRRTTQDFYPGEYQRDYVMVHDTDGERSRRDRLTPQEIVDGLRTGNSWTATGQVIDRLAFTVCTDAPLPDVVSNAFVEASTLLAAVQGGDVELPNCASMGEKLVVPEGAELIVSIALRDPRGTNYAPYTFPNPSLQQIGVDQPLNKPVLDHVDVIRGDVTGYKDPQKPAEYAGEWPRDWIDHRSLQKVPAAAKNTSAKLWRTFSGRRLKNAGDSELTRGFKTVTFRFTAEHSQYLRLRGTNLPPSVPWETDADGNALPDLHTNSSSVAFENVVAGQPPEFPEGHFLKIPCLTPGTNVPANNVVYTGDEIDGCPAHLPANAAGQKMSALDVAAWADLWFYSNPIYIEVEGSYSVAGVK